ncbi:hypothetical protein Gbro_1445 [Gordonia bronchialis DSM 43247]|uniref:Uncharacterized protein n=1 Tax=Gordonia bronchialis (strain ATCC 25592 / DSM 43247 / BCRC 13721 / JCM 3198 / KCTC 3076 / NBRC 16047 / NCTC 10667) TaxID=526226 RepID=D0L6G9_GORB4|nr:hypothetical protein Gbro_1445 [Gordonia bronchialis DSM 43247]STQ63557.1 Uncharacterised protein [Gordonia bronchialis]
MTSSHREDVEERVRAEICRSPDIYSAILVGSQSKKNSDNLSDLDYFLFTKDIDRWDRERVRELFLSSRLNPHLIYWNGLSKFHSIVDGFGVDFSVLHISRQDDIRRWPTLFYELEGIIKDPDQTIRRNTLNRESSPRAGIDNTLDGLIYHLMNVSIQLRRGEFINARCRLTGVVEALLCYLEDRTLGQPNFREPSRRYESRDSANRDLVSRLAFSASPMQIIDGCRHVVDWIEFASQGTISSNNRTALRIVERHLQEAHQQCDTLP